MQEIHAIVTKVGKGYTAEVPGALDIVIQAANLDELEQKIIGRLSEKEELAGVTFTVVRKMVREYSTPQSEESESDGARWVLWRQDARGERFQVSSHATVTEAEGEQEKLKAAGTKELYWVEPERTPLSPEDSNDIWEFEQ